MYVFDEKGTMQEISIQDIECIKREVIQRKTLFCIGSKWLTEPNTLAMLGQVYNQFGFHQIDKNKLVNLNKVDEFKDGFLWIGDSKYPVSSRKLPEIKKILQ